MRKLGYLLKNIGLKNKIWWLIRIGHYLSSDKKITQTITTMI